MHTPHFEPLQLCVPHTQRGDSLLSLLVAMSVVALLATTGLTGYRHWHEGQRLETGLRQLSRLVASGLDIARMEHRTVVLCDSIMPKCGTDWSRGITLRRTASTQPLLSVRWPDGLRIEGPGHRLFLTPRAFDAGANGTFYLCPTVGNGQQLVFNRMGQPRTASVPAQDCHRRLPRQSL